MTPNFEYKRYHISTIKCDKNDLSPIQDMFWCFWFSILRTLVWFWLLLAFNCSLFVTSSTTMTGFMYKTFDKMTKSLPQSSLPARQHLPWCTGELVIDSPCHGLPTICIIHHCWSDTPVVSDVKRPDMTRWEKQHRNGKGERERERWRKKKRKWTLSNPQTDGCGNCWRDS